MFSNRCVIALLTAIAVFYFIHWTTLRAEGFHDILANELYTQDIIAGDVFFEIVEPAELEYTYRLRPAKDFGAPFNASFKLENAALILAEPPDACTELENYSEVNGNVVMIERGDCSFLAKTLNAEKAGARAVIITESDMESSEYEYYIEMVHDNSNQDATIPAGFLLGKSSRVIRYTLERLNKRYAIINLPVNLTFTPPHLINHPPWLGW